VQRGRPGDLFERTAVPTLRLRRDPAPPPGA
jgi:hypothetical protein